MITTTMSFQEKIDNSPQQLNIPSKIEIGTLPVAITCITLLITIGITWGKLNTLVSEIKKTLDNEVKPDLKNIRERFIVVESRVDTIWKDRVAPASSPRQLNNVGLNILTNSGIKKVVDEKKSKLLEIIKEKKISNAYDAEETIINVMAKLPEHCTDIIEQLKNGAFSVGADINVVLFVGGIYLRNEIFPDLGFSINDLDKPKI